MPELKPSERKNRGWEAISRNARSAVGARSRSSDFWLKECLSRNAETEYGRRYAFESIRGAEEYRARVPLVSYEDLEPSIRRIAEGTPDVLFQGLPAAFEKTGGSGGGEKIVPYTLESLRDFREALLPWLGTLVEKYRLCGSAYMAISPAMRRPTSTPSGIPVGLPDGAYLGEEVLYAFADISAVPPSVGAVASFGDWQLATLRHLLQADDMELISVWSPTFMLQLLDGLRQRAEELSALLCSGGSGESEALNRLERYLSSGTEDTRVLWPRLKIISCWTDASSAPFAARLAARAPQAEMQGKGLLLTEGAVTVPDAAGRTLLSPCGGFFEFLDAAGRPFFHRELKAGEVYEVVMTTSGGLYRYRAGDAVRCEGRVDGLPALRFVGRCGTASDLVGEKLTDAFVSQCMEKAGCCGMLVPRALPEPGYILLIDRATESNLNEDARRLEEELRKNPQYAYARALEQLASLAVRDVDALTKRHMDFAVSRGRRPGDVKFPSLCTENGWLEEIERTKEVPS